VAGRAPIADPVETLLATTRAFYRVEAPASPGGRAIELDGLTAFVTPSAPAQSIVNGVIVERGRTDALAAQLDTLSALYAEAGVTQWMVWARPGDAATAALLEAAGHVREYEPLALALALEALSDAPAPGPADPAFTLDREPDPAEIVALNERANGELPGAFGAALSGVAGEAFHRYLARVDGRAAACLVTFDHERDCMVTWVATDPDLQHRRLGGRLLHAALRDARARGMRSSTLQSSYEGERLYAGLGYRSHGRLTMWRHEP
jgi:GNAT superfamily N-acetyltransferase